jgi:hypothetical protein
MANSRLKFQAHLQNNGSEFTPRLFSSTIDPNLDCARPVATSTALVPFSASKDDPHHDAQKEKQIALHHEFIDYLNRPDNDLAPPPSLFLQDEETVRKLELIADRRVNSEIFRTVLDDQPFEDRDPRDDRFGSLGLYAKVKELELEQVNNLVVALMTDRLRHIDEPTAQKLLAIFTATTDDSLVSLRQAAAEEKLVSTMRTLDLANHMINTAYGELGEVEEAQQRVKAAMEPLKAMIKNSLTGFETDVKTFKNEVEHL